MKMSVNRLCMETGLSRIMIEPENDTRKVAWQRGVRDDVTLL